MLNLSFIHAAQREHHPPRGLRDEDSLEVHEPSLGRGVGPARSAVGCNSPGWQAILQSTRNSGLCNWT